MSAATPRPSTPKAAKAEKPAAVVKPAASGKSSSSGKPARKRVRGRSLSWLGGHALGLGVALSVLLHGVFGAMNFVAPPGGLKKLEEKGLQVVLVNSRHKKPPRDAQALAQANLDGGGEQADQKHMPTSPLPPQDSVRDGEAVAEAQQRVRQMEARQRELLALAQGSKKQVAPERAKQSEETPSETKPTERGLDLNSAQAIARQEAVVDKLVKDYASRPRKGFISPRTKEHKLAMYGEAFRLKLERIGEVNFPRSARGSMYGSVMVVVEIRPDGSLESAEIARPNANPKLNEAALRIVRLAAPYARIPDELRKDYDILVLARTMNFTRDEISVEQ
ncbi:energy transducer TonB family protein [Uliginosibacterium aquaticum]|uniref:TonB family protein n=1 Tax=Uliginosibacterium aquaticum TaxID=2731212 RepID=A0ABX2IET3_9RHOO|nr:energy transducer TonB [Uliginosibacterium aquaticum]NSL53442.1 TonB family protein [Uliginosibacterium aquaticum]